MLKTLVLTAFCAFTWIAGAAQDHANNFASPPDSARPWVFWFWINGNISQEGITADLEAMKRVGVGGVLWMEVSGPWWAPEGKVRAPGAEWHDCMQWAIRESDRLGMKFDLSVDFGYGSGGPHITPDLSMQKLYWSETEVEGGRELGIVLPRPTIKKAISAWLRPGAQVDEKVRDQIENMDSYRDVAVVAMPIPSAPNAREYRIPGVRLKDGTDWRLPQTNTPAPPSESAVPAESIVDLTGQMTPDGRLTWKAPAGNWLIFRYGHASNFKMTRPCPATVVGLECDRLSKAGIDAHYNGFLKRIFEGTGSAAGKALTYVHIDSWEAGGQNWTATFPAEFRARRGYDLRAWLPVLAGRVVGSAELSDRFLWDVRTTVSEMIRDNYAGRLRELAQGHGIKLSIEAYGRLCIDNLAYAGACDMPISEFWAKGSGTFPAPGGYENSTKAMSSVAHTYGKPVVGAESFTSDRAWRDHPFLLKGMGDRKFCQGLNQVIFHLYAHQAYDKMIPGLTHRKWGEHVQRHNTWWEFSHAWMQYLARCQYLLQQGQFVADACYWVGEGAPLNVNDMALELPKGYDFDFCSSEIVLKMSVKDGNIVLPSGVSYRYLQLPDTDRVTLPLARKMDELVKAGARVVGTKQFQGTPGLTNFRKNDAQVAEIGAALWKSQRAPDKTLAGAFARDQLLPDFEGGGLEYMHRRIDEADMYFVCNPANLKLDVTCKFRVAGKSPELWDPETGTIRALPEYVEAQGRIAVPLRFEPMQSWFVVFREPNAVTSRNTSGGRNFAPVEDKFTFTAPWQVSFDPRWGGPEKPVEFAVLEDWSKNPDNAIRYFSGTAVYRQRFQAPNSLDKSNRIFLDLGSVEVMARVRLNGIDCGVAWKPPYRVEVSQAVRAGENDLEISVVNLWINRLIGDEQLPLDGNWKDFETLLEWPAWFVNDSPRDSGRYTFTSCRHYQKDSPLAPSGLMGPVKLQSSLRR